MIVSSAEVAQASRVGRRYRGPARVVFVVNTDRFFLSHRASWGVALQSAGADITVLAEDTGGADVVRQLGFAFIDIRIGRETTSSIFGSARAAIRIFLELCRIRPGLVFLVHQVAYTIGWPAALLLREARFIRVAGGIGRGLDTAVLQTGTSRVIQLSGRLAGGLRNVFTLFQLTGDRETFARLGMLPEPERSVVLPGTGIDVSSWHAEPSRDFDKPVILFASRLLQEKGVQEFVAASEALRGRGWRFQVAGDPDPGVTSSITDTQIAQWRKVGAVEILGHRNDMSRVFGGATLFVFPTRHPEGTSRVLIEAGASGLPSVVSGHPGCAAVVEDGVTGIVLKAEPSSAEVTEAIEALASDPSRARAMGAAARDRISRLFSLECALTTLLDWDALGVNRR